ncbi:MAG TPA: hypothetical protein VMX94_03405 [Armatimonadota bacterium]|nr:hypothetical protein [Armatimonadota bacterium]
MVAVVIGIAVIVWLVTMVSKYPALRHAAECQANLQNPDPKNQQDISGALERYARKKGKYPAGLEELHPNFLENRKILHCPADKRPVRIVSYEYAPPAMNAPPGTVVIRCDRHVIIRGRPPLALMLHKDGRITTQGFGAASSKPK